MKPGDALVLSFAITALTFPGCRSSTPAPGTQAPRPPLEANVAAVPAIVPPSPAPVPSQTPVPAAAVVPQASACVVEPAGGIASTDALRNVQGLSITALDGSHAAVVVSAEDVRDGGAGRAVYHAAIGSPLAALELSVEAGGAAAADSQGEPGSGDQPVPRSGAAIARPDALATLTFGQAAPDAPGMFRLFPASTPPVGSEPVYVEAGPMAAAWRPNFVFAAMAGRQIEHAPEAGTAEPSATDAGAAPPVRVVVQGFVQARNRVFTPVLYAPRGAARYEQPDAPAVAVGATRAAVAFRAAGKIWVAPVGPRGQFSARLQQVVHGDVGAPSIAYRGDTLYLVYAQREAPRTPYTLRWTAWDPEHGVAPPAQVIATGAQSAIAPSLATTGERVVLTWTDASAATGTVRIASTTGDLGGIAANAITVSSTGHDAHDSEIAYGSGGGWLGWLETGEDGTRVVVSGLRCE